MKTELSSYTSSTSAYSNNISILDTDTAITTFSTLGTLSIATSNASTSTSTSTQTSTSNNNLNPTMTTFSSETSYTTSPPLIISQKASEFSNTSYTSKTTNSSAIEAITTSMYSNPENKTTVEVETSNTTIWTGQIFTSFTSPETTFLNNQTTVDLTQLLKQQELVAQDIMETEDKLKEAEAQKIELDTLSSALDDVKSIIKNLTETNKYKRSVEIPQNCTDFIYFLDELNTFIGAENYTFALMYALGLKSSNVTCSQAEVISVRNKTNIIDGAIERVQNQTRDILSKITELSNTLTELNKTLELINNQISYQNLTSTGSFVLPSTTKNPAYVETKSELYSQGSSSAMIRSNSTETSSLINQPPTEYTGYSSGTSNYHTNETSGPIDDVTSKSTFSSGEVATFTEAENNTLTNYLQSSSERTTYDTTLTKDVLSINFSSTAYPPTDHENYSSEAIFSHTNLASESTNYSISTTYSSTDTSSPDTSFSENSTNVYETVIDLSTDEHEGSSDMTATALLSTKDITVTHVSTDFLPTDSSNLISNATSSNAGSTSESEYYTISKDLSSRTTTFSNTEISAFSETENEFESTDLQSTSFVSTELPSTGTENFSLTTLLSQTNGTRDSVVTDIPSTNFSNLTSEANYETVIDLSTDEEEGSSAMTVNSSTEDIQ
jgi:trimeric autotransporter adhesin